MRLRLLLLAPGFSICKLAADAPVPSWVAGRSVFTSISRSSTELSLICPRHVIPDDVAGMRARSDGWRCLRIEEATEPEATPGILASVVEPLARAGVSVFAVASFDTDHLLVNDPHTATGALRAAGHTIAREPGRE